MVRVVVLYGEAPDASEYEAHAELCRLVPGATFRATIQAVYDLAVALRDRGPLAEAELGEYGAKVVE